MPGRRSALRHDSGSMEVTVCDVGPRDGLQNDEAVLAPGRARRAVRAARRDRAAARGGRELRPSEAGAADGGRRGGVRRPRPAATASRWAALVLNRKGLERAVAAQAEEIHVAYPVTETFARRNQNMGVEEAATAAAEIVDAAHAAGLRATVTLGGVVRLPVRGPRRPRRGGRPRSPQDGGRRRADARRHDRRRRARARCGGCCDASAGDVPGRPAPAQHAQHRLRQRLRRAGGGRDAVRRLGRRPRRLPVRAARDRQHRHRGPALPARGRGRRHRRRPRRRDRASPSGCQACSAARCPAWCIAPTASDSDTTSPYLASMSNRFASCAACQRSPTHSRGTIGASPCCSASTTVARTQPEVRRAAHDERVAAGEHRRQRRPEERRRERLRRAPARRRGGRAARRPRSSASPAAAPPAPGPCAGRRRRRARSPRRRRRW